MAVGTALRQLRTRRKLRDQRFLPSDERAYLKGQILRRSAIAALLVTIGSLIAGYYLSDMDARMGAIVGKNLPPDDPAGLDDRNFARFVAIYWISILLMVFTTACFAVVDFWSTRWYWLSQYRRIEVDHDIRLQRDLAVYRQQKDDARFGKS